MKLREYLFKNYKSATDFAKELGISRVYLDKIKNGRQIPSRKLILKIELLTGGQVTKEDLWK